MGETGNSEGGGGKKSESVGEGKSIREREGGGYISVCFYVWCVRSVRVVPLPACILTLVHMTQVHMDLSVRACLRASFVSACVYGSVHVSLLV